MTRRAAEVVVLLAENQLRAYRVAKVMPCNVNAVMYHVYKIKRETGFDPRDFYGMTELLPVAKAVLDEREE